MTRRLAALLWLLLLPDLTAAGVEDLPCVLCHPSRDRQVYDRLSERADVLVGSESAQAFVCMSCHNGSVVDSRERLLRGAQHPVGVRSSRSSAGEFPLYGDSRLECGTCHSPHGDTPQARRWLRAPDDGLAPCAGCHGDHRDRHLGRSVSGRMAVSVTAAGGRLGTRGEVTCFTCHSPHGGRGRALLVAPYGAGQDDLCRVCHGDLTVKGVGPGRSSQPCSECHVAHSSGPRMLTGGAAGPCVPCHADKRSPADHPAADGACGDCHSVHSPVRPDGSAAGLLRMPAAGGLLCTPCHPGLGGAHRPSSPLGGGIDLGLLAARGLRLGPGRELECTTCHRVHGAADAPLLGLAEAVLCLYCHAEANPFGNRGVKVGTHPVGVLLQPSQRTAVGAEEANAAGSALTCASCHRAHGAAEIRPTVTCLDCHPERSESAGHGGVPGCGACHEIHGEVAPAKRCEACHAGHAAGLHPADTAVPAGILPAFDSAGRPVPAGSMGCPTCHDPHGKGGGLLRRDSPGSTCLVCHENRSRLLGGPHDPATLGDDRDPCRRCHPSHPAESERPTAADPAGDACRACHPDRAVLPAHGPEGVPAWKSLREDLPFFDRDGRRNTYGFMTCPTCHDVHAAPADHALRLAAPDRPRVCLACHGEKSSLLGTAHDPATGKKAEPGGARACTGCHPAHGQGTAPTAWASGKAGQGTWNDRKCSPCHGDGKGGVIPHGTAPSHPVDVAVPSRIRVQGLPLFDPLGGRNGRLVTCATCHDIHGAPGNGGPVARFLRRDPHDGGLCVACHEEQGAVTATPHDLSSSSQGAPLGPCSPCHSVHRGASPRALWGMEPAPGDYLPNTLCRSCHRRGGLAQPEFLLLQYHMKDGEEMRNERGAILLQWPMSLLDELSLRTGNRPIIPLYGRDGEEGPQGSLQCVSCHEPHVWSPMGPFVKPGFGSLGPNVPTHFLRLKDPQAVERSVCAGCHKDGAVERYIKYHFVWGDVGKEFR